MGVLIRHLLDTFALTVITQCDSPRRRVHNARYLEQKLISLQNFGKMTARFSYTCSTGAEIQKRHNENVLRKTTSPSSSLPPIFTLSPTPTVLRVRRSQKNKIKIEKDSKKQFNRLFNGQFLILKLFMINLNRINGH